MRMFISGMILVLSPLTLLATPCTFGTLQSYVNLGSIGCELGNRLIADFKLVPGPPTTPPFIVMDPTLVTLTPGGTLLQPELLVTTPYTAAPGQIPALWFDFAITGVLSGVSLELHSPSFSGDGGVSAVLDACPDGFFTIAPFGCPPGTAQPFITVGASRGNERLSASMPLRS